MFIGCYKLDGEECFSIYNKKNNGWSFWFEDTFSPTCEDIKLLDFKVKGKTYKERQNYLVELAKDWQYNFSQYSWSYGELAVITDWFYKNGKRYGLLKEFRENAIC